MAKFDISSLNADMKAALEVIGHIQGALCACDAELNQIRASVSRGGGKASVVSALGSRSADIQEAYNDIKVLIQKWTNLTPEDL